MLDKLQPLILLLAVLAVPVLLIAAYDKWILAPKRPRTPEGEVAPGPLYVRVADLLLPFVLVAVVLKIGVSEVFGWAKDIAIPLSWFAAPIGLWCAIDSWIFAPRRQIQKGARDIQDPPVLRAAYALLPVLVVAVIIRLISAETLDFSLVLLLLSVATGLVWLIDHLVFRKEREKAMLKGVGGETTLPEPGTVDYARSFFPVAFIVLIVRAFIFEPFRIPSDSMMPTLLDGDFIVVNKFAYGLRWPVLNQKFLGTGTPQRGEVVVFRYPPDPSINYIKRLVGLPGDRIEVRDDHLVINGQVIEQVDQGRFTDGCYLNMRQTQRDARRTHPRGVVVPIGVRDVAGARSAIGRRRFRLTTVLRSHEDSRVRQRGLPVRRVPLARAARLERLCIPGRGTARPLPDDRRQSRQQRR